MRQSLALSALLALDRMSTRYQVPRADTQATHSALYRVYRVYQTSITVSINSEVSGDYKCDDNFLLCGQERGESLSHTGGYDTY